MSNAELKVVRFCSGRLRFCIWDDGKSYAYVAEALFIDDDTVRGWHKQYQTGGWDLVAST